MNLPGALSDVVLKASSKTAIFYGDQQITYGQILAQTRSLAAYLQIGLGWRPGARVGLWLKNCPEFVPAFFSILEAGGVVVPINNFLKPTRAEVDSAMPASVIIRSTAEAACTATAILCRQCRARYDTICYARKNIVPLTHALTSTSKAVI